MNWPELLADSQIRILTITSIASKSTLIDGLRGTQRHLPGKYLIGTRSHPRSKISPSISCPIMKIPERGHRSYPKI